ncbi:MAG: hypothetical protein KJO44_08455 [Gemmatimonadetes bacterium]|nr:hypothetical protein [Gemmatimonadota bacterium]MBT8478608.1 hypothetical protein [Gemmatimonadota bacterium]NNK47402.1 hypothetical protein [Gemmatimonadota bacterium]
MRVLRTILIVLALAVLAAHFSRAGANLLAGLLVLAPLLLLVRQPWAGWTLRVALLVGGLEWVRTVIRLVGERRATGDDWTRLAVILIAVALLTFLASWAVPVRGAGTQDSSSG